MFSARRFLASLVFGIAFNTSALEFSPLAQGSTRELSPSEKIRAAQDLALSYLRKSVREDSQVREMYYIENTNLYGALSLANFNIPAAGRDWTRCTEDRSMVAYTLFNNRKSYGVWLCRRAFKGTAEDLAQAMLHEAIHFEFHVTNECTASYWEIRIVHKGGGVPYKNGYVDHCSKENPYLNEVTYGRQFGQALTPTP